MGRACSFGTSVLAILALAGCEAPAPDPARIEIAPTHRSCQEGDACGVVETSCRSEGCECGVAVNEAHLLDYQERLAQCRGQQEIASCDFECATPFAKCFKGACVLTDEPPDLVRRGRSVAALCERTRGIYRGCPECPPNERCKSCVPCECPSSHRWTTRGCHAVLKTEARDVRIETRPARATSLDEVKVRVHNESPRPIWLKTRCGTPFHTLRKKEDAWELAYGRFPGEECRSGSVKIGAGKSRPFVAGSLASFEGPSDQPVTPGTYRFEVTFTDRNGRFDYSAVVYSTELELMARVSSR